MELLGRRSRRHGHAYMYALRGHAHLRCTATFAFIVQVDPETLGGSTITDTVSINSTTTDPNPGNNSLQSNAITVQGADLSMTQVASVTAVSTVAPDSTITYTETVTNNGPNAAVTAVLYQATPPNTTFASVTPPAGWTCGTVPAVGATGQVICTDGANLNSGTTTTAFTYVVTVNPGPTPPAPAAGTTIVNSADVTSTTTDPVVSNNATTTSVLVETTGDSDLAVSMTASPTPVFVSSPITYTIQITNLGLAAGTGVSVVDTLPVDARRRVRYDDVREVAELRRAARPTQSRATSARSRIRSLLRSRSPLPARLPEPRTR